MNPTMSAFLRRLDALPSAEDRAEAWRLLRAADLRGAEMWVVGCEARLASEEVET